MFLTYLLLALSLSIDSIGIGITYGLKNTRIPNVSKFILFIISIFFTTISLDFGKLLTYILSNFLAQFIGSFVLIIIGIWSLFINNTSSFDFDDSKTIDWKESIFLGIALSIDSVSVSIGSGIAGLTSFYFPILVATFHLAFLFFGKFLGHKITRIKKFPENVYTKISGILLIIIGITRLFV